MPKYFYFVCSLTNGLTKSHRNWHFDRNSFWKEKNKLFSKVESNCANSSKYSKGLVNVAVIGLTGYATKYLVHNRNATCTPKHPRHIEEKIEIEDTFDWYKFFHMLKPDIWSLLVAVGVRYVQ